MSSILFHQPDIALKRANELIAIGNQNGALDLLQGVFANRKHKTWQKAYEELMIKFIDLCINLQKHREAKDGLHQYRNMTQQQAPNSLEIIINHLIDRSEVKASMAKEKATLLNAEVVTHIGDLETEVSPESIMLSTMTEEGGKERTDHEIVVPWLRFLWEAYRSVLDVLKTNTKLEGIYHSTCIKAFNFCKTYSRTQEFRRLCETLRIHISNIQTYGTASAGGKLRGWEGWTTDNIELHLQTRFAQLEVAANLELWTEGFRTVEDIYNIMQIGKKIPKAKLMASYYEKLTRIFFVSENYLFHAYAWYKYYSLSREYNKSLTPKERQIQASSVLLAALSIPEVKNKCGHVESAYDDDDLSKEKNQRMAMLLGFNTDPSRSNLLQELIAKGMLLQVIPEIKILYAEIEKQNSPLTIVKKSLPLLQVLKSESYSATLGVYVRSLERVITLRILEGLSKLYRTVTLDKFHSYFKGLEISMKDVEKLIVRVSKNKEIMVTINYEANCLLFNTGVLETEGMRSQLTNLAVQLQNAVNLISTSNVDSVVPRLRNDNNTKFQKRKIFFAEVMSRMDKEHTLALSRKETIESRKEENERREQDKLREAARLKAEEEARRKEDEAIRLAREAKVREMERQQRIEEELAVAETRNMLSKLGKKVDNIESMDKEARETAIRTAKDEILSEKDKEEKRLKEQAKRIDYIIRALRTEEKTLLMKKMESDFQKATAEYERRKKEFMEKHRADWEAKLSEKSATSMMQPHRKDFEKILYNSQIAFYEEKVRRAKEQKLQKHREGKLERAMKRREEEMEKRAAEEERRRIEEEEKQSRITKQKEIEEEERRTEAKEKNDEEGRMVRREGSESQWKAEDVEWKQTPFRPSRASNNNGPSEGSWRSGMGTGLTGERRQSGFDDRRGSFMNNERRFSQHGGFDRPSSGAVDEFRGRGSYDDNREARGDDRRGSGNPSNMEKEGSWRRSAPPLPPPPTRSESDRPPEPRPDGRTLGRIGTGRSLADLAKDFTTR